jgi:hypothetical protein
VLQQAHGARRKQPWQQKQQQQQQQHKQRQEAYVPLEPVQLSEKSPMYLPVLTDEDLAADPPDHKSGYVAVIGRPNAGVCVCVCVCVCVRVCACMWGQVCAGLFFMRVQSLWVCGAMCGAPLQPQHLAHTHTHMHAAMHMHTPGPLHTTHHRQEHAHQCHCGPEAVHRDVQAPDHAPQGGRHRKRHRLAVSPGGPAASTGLVVCVGVHARARGSASRANQKLTCAVCATPLNTDQCAKTHTHTHTQRNAPPQATR